MKKPLIFITNDDGINAKGIRSLVEAAEEFGELVIIAPDKPQSGMGHAITISEPLRLYPSSVFGKHQAYSCSGTPVDCVKLGIYEVMHRKPDLLLSGINHGENTSTNVLYSGTMSAAIEGAMENIPSIGFSLKDFHPEADFDVAKEVAKNLIEKALKNGMAKHICLNVNIPRVTSKELKGIKICKQAHAFWEDRFDKREDQFGRPYYWLTGNFECQTEDQETDLIAMENGYASVVPTQFDLTAYEAMNELKKWEE
ncbi:MAG: 5'-nucleotidase [Psychromonas sp.]